MKNLLLSLVFVLSLSLVSAQIPETYKNPILPGGNPDPSMCKVGDYYYLVNSSFIWFPGVPIHRSKDLVNWEFLCYAFSRPEQLNVSDKTGPAGGIWAPTIRFNKGVFYITVTQKNAGSSVLITATNPAGPWSNPITLHQQNGIDGSLLFDDNDHVWYTWSEDHIIKFMEFDLPTKQLVGDTIRILDENMFEGYTNIEGPHIYKHKGSYYLLIAAGGTGTNKHNVSIFKSEKPQGPYTPCPTNPVLTHNNTDSPFTCMGHADIVETQNGEWWAVMLGVRMVEGKATIMGRETFLTSLVWDGEWPVFNPKGGNRVLEVDKRPNLPWTPVIQPESRDDFNSKELKPIWNFYHTPQSIWWSLTERKGSLQINLQPAKLTDQTNTPVIAQRITQASFTATTKIDFDPKNENETAGLTAIMNQNGMFKLEVALVNGERKVRLIMAKSEKRQPPVIETLGEISVPSKGDLVLQLVADKLSYRFFAGESITSLKQVGDTADAMAISKERAGGYSGAYIGMFATSNNTQSNNKAWFDYFDYSTKP